MNELIQLKYDFPNKNRNIWEIKLIFRSLFKLFFNNNLNKDYLVTGQDYGLSYYLNPQFIKYNKLFIISKNSNKIITARIPAIYIRTHSNISESSINYKYKIINNICNFSNNSFTKKLNNIYLYNELLSYIKIKSYRIHYYEFTFNPHIIEFLKDCKNDIQVFKILLDYIKEYSNLDSNDLDHLNPTWEDFTNYLFK